MFAKLLQNLRLGRLCRGIDLFGLFVGVGEAAAEPRWRLFADFDGLMLVGPVEWNSTINSSVIRAWKACGAKWWGAVSVW